MGGVYAKSGRKVAASDTVPSCFCTNKVGLRMMMLLSWAVGILASSAEPMERKTYLFLGVWIICSNNFLALRAAGAAAEGALVTLLRSYDVVAAGFLTLMAHV